MKKAKLLFVLFTMASLIAHSNNLLLKAEDSLSYSFVYSYGNAKIWVFIDTNKSLVIGSSQNSSILLAIYLEELGTNVAIFLNRVTFSIEGTQFERELSPNVTLDSTLRSWSYDITIEKKDVVQILLPVLAISGRIYFELRYDVIDSAGKYWSYRANEEFPQSFTNTDYTIQPFLSFETIFVVISVLGIASALVLLYFRIRRYKKTNVQILGQEKR